MIIENVYYLFNISIPWQEFNPVTFLVPVPIQDLHFQHHMSWSFLCSASSDKTTGDCSFWSTALLQGKWTLSWTNRLRPQIRVCETICTCSCRICYTKPSNNLFILSAGKHAIALLTHYPDSLPTSLCSYCLMLCAYRRRANTNFIVFGLTRPGLKPTIYHTWPLHQWYGRFNGLQIKISKIFSVKLPYKIKQLLL